MSRDYIVDEVRRIREEIAAECGYDPKRFSEWISEVEKTWPGKVVTKEELLRGRRAGTTTPKPATEDTEATEKAEG